MLGHFCITKQYIILLYIHRIIQTNESTLSDIKVVGTVKQSKYLVSKQHTISSPHNQRNLTTYPIPFVKCVLICSLSDESVIGMSTVSITIAKITAQLQQHSSSKFQC